MDTLRLDVPIERKETDGMPSRYQCTNRACPNKDRGWHMTRQAAVACQRVSSHSPGGQAESVLASAWAAPAGSGRRSLTLASLAEARAEGRMTDDEVLAISGFEDLDADESDVLLDLVAAESESPPADASAEGLAQYIREAYTGHDSLTEWAEEAMLSRSDTVRLGESAENYAETALREEIWALYRRDGSGDYRVMIQSPNR